MTRFVRNVIGTTTSGRDRFVTYSSFCTMEWRFCRFCSGSFVASGSTLNTVLLAGSGALSNTACLLNDDIFRSSTYQQIDICFPHGSVLLATQES